jgi:hypothetical protein
MLYKQMKYTVYKHRVTPTHMFSGLMSSVALCREHNRSICTDEVKAPTRFVRGISMSARSNTIPFVKRFLCPSETTSYSTTNENAPWQREYVEALLYGGETLSLRLTPHRDHALLSRHGQDGVIAPWSPGSGVDEEVNLLVSYWSRWKLSEHDVQVDAAEDLLKGVESEPTQFTLDEVGAVLHDSLELHVPVPALPARDEVEHVGALCSLAVLPAGVAGKSDAKSGEERKIGGLVPHSEKASEKVDFTGDSRDSQEACSTHNEEREYCFVSEPWINVCSFLENNDVTVSEKSVSRLEELALEKN